MGNKVNIYEEITKPTKTGKLLMVGTKLNNTRKQIYFKKLMKKFKGQYYQIRP